jgi:hypothetical protein
MLVGIVSQFSFLGWSSISQTTVVLVINLRFRLLFLLLILLHLNIYLISASGQSNKNSWSSRYSPKHRDTSMSLPPRVSYKPESEMMVYESRRRKKRKDEASFWVTGWVRLPEGLPPSANVHGQRFGRRSPQTSWVWVDLMFNLE